MHLDRTELPAGNIMERWRKDCTEEDMRGKYTTKESKNEETTAYIQKKLMVKKVLALAGVDGALDEEGYKEAMEALDKIISVKTLGGKGVGALGSESEITRPTLCPERPTRKGRPHNTDLKSYEASLKKQKTKLTSDKKAGGRTTTDEENQAGGRTRALSELMSIYQS